MKPLNTIHKLAFRGSEFFVFDRSSEASNWLMNSFNLEYQLRDEWWHINTNDVVIDVGAAYGSYTFTALAQGAALVIAYEPCMSELFDLTTNLALNNWFDRCWLVPFLAGNDEGVYEGFYPASHSIMPKEWPSPRLVLPIDKLMANTGLQRLDWIKIDAEGAELAIVEGAGKTLEKFHPKLLIENHNAFIEGIGDAVREVLVPLGYIEQNKRGPAGGNDDWSLWVWKEKII